MLREVVEDLPSGEPDPEPGPCHRPLSRSGHRARVATALSLRRVSVPGLVARLRNAVASTGPGHVIVTESGDEYESLFETFLPTDNPGRR
ncbi:hypothetical protein GCM10010377_42730 [Streptomyces viridiviolaceus]|nr:hypothetical protein GCM10010377_42730 [Streptomyces viridiviolaceus]